MRRRVGLPEQDGLLVADVAEGSPAAAAELSQGDLIVKVGGQSIATIDDVWDALDRVGDQVEIEVLRGTEIRTVVVSFAEATDSDGGDDGASAKPSTDA